MAKAMGRTKKPAGKGAVKPKGMPMRGMVYGKAGGSGKTPKMPASGRR